MTTQQLQLEGLGSDATGAVAGPDAPALTSEQRAAVERRGEALLLSAAAGSGKTSVLVERFVRAVREDGIAPASILAITFTERAAGELRARVRAQLLALGERDAARDTETAFVGTFHGFCARLLRSHPVPAGLDPDFAILDEGRARALAELAFERAVAEFAGAGGEEAVELLAAYGVDGARAIVKGLHAELRSRGQLSPRLPVPDDDDGGAGTEPLEQAAIASVALFDRLLATFSDVYRRIKDERTAVDFDDLELLAGRLLSEHRGIREAWSQRFALLMVDEFQDTNPRQLSILSALERDNLFTVGDEFQAIYGFRHADVELFRTRRAALADDGASLALTRNFRSRAPLLDVVNGVFGERLPGFPPLVADPDRDAGPAGAAVELLLTSARGWDRDEVAEAVGAGLPHSQTWRQAEARLLARRVAELVASGQARAGEIVVLLRATSAIEVFERALQLQGLRTLATAGTFWDHQQIADLHCYLRALANPRDEEALYSALASPLCGCSRDGLALLARAARASHRGAWETAVGLCEGDEDAGALPERDRDAVARFCSWLAAERRSAPGTALPELIERAIAHSGYRDHVLSLDWGERRMANVHKLLRLAGRFEAAEGRDLRAFVDHVDHLKRSAVLEPDAPVGGVEPDAVRLMTIHAAKGLEFPVVCVADLGRQPNVRTPTLLVDGDRVGLRVHRLDAAEAEPALDFEALRAERRAREAEEEDRVLYVAMTRARERLLLSGTIAFEPGSRSNGIPAPISWLVPALCPALGDLDERSREASVLELAAGASGSARLRCTLFTPEAHATVLTEAPQGPATGEAGEASPSAGTRAARATGRSTTPPRAPAGAFAGPPALPATLSYSSLAELERCGYRYYLERVLGMAEDRGRGAGREGIDARSRGTIVHRLLEAVDFASPRTPGDGDVAAAAGELGLELAAADRERIAQLVAGAPGTALGRRIGAARRVRREHPFAFVLGPREPLVTGVIDLTCEEQDGNVLVIDYKSDHVERDTDLEALLERDYAVQRLLYALAALREGALVVEVAHWFLERPDEPVTARYTLAERAPLEAALAERLARAWADPYAVSAGPHRSLCATCPGRASLCSWSEEHTLRELPDA